MDKKTKSAVNKLHSRLATLKDILEKCRSTEFKDDALKEHVKQDLFLAYTTTSLYWAYLKTQGVDPNNHPIKDEIERIKTYMAKSKTIHDRHLRPKVNQEASKKFVRNALWTPKQPENAECAERPGKTK